MKWRWVFVAFAVAFALGALAVVLQGQEVIADSVTVRVLERPEIVVLEGPSQAYRGDILTFQARALDADGNPTLAFLAWSLSDTSKARFVSVADSTARVEALARGTFTVRVRVGPLDSLRIGMVDSTGAFVLPEDDPENTLRIPLQVDPDSVVAALEPGMDGDLVLTVGYKQSSEPRQLCALFFSGSVPWGFSGYESCYPAWVARYGPTNAPARPDFWLTVYGLPHPAPPLAVLAALIRETTQASRLTIGRVL